MDGDAWRRIVDMYVTLALAAASILGGHCTARRQPTAGWHPLLLFLLGALVLTAVALLAPVMAAGLRLRRRRALLWAIGWASGVAARTAGFQANDDDDDGGDNISAAYMALGVATALFGSFGIAARVARSPRAVYGGGAAAFGAASLGWIALLGRGGGSKAAAAAAVGRPLWDPSLLVVLAALATWAALHTRAMLARAARGRPLDPVVHAMWFFGAPVAALFRAHVLLSDWHARRADRAVRGALLSGRHCLRCRHARRCLSR
ncbi:hypothetical protein H4R18_005387 [Coemansia javaensis]|uniref:Uncharacterized protein n=1 Tax=Coemansia javaensis TaxID=2761396 RepID=A0A9W8LEW6_9FUNG|nr:hypothetical protein H4R18_005387 [Coemansia javaensis]